jgi:hypothetical protein
VGELVAAGLLGVLTGLLGTSQHLARTDVLGVLVPYGLLLALALVVATDLAMALATTGGPGEAGRPRPLGTLGTLGPGRALLAVAAGRGLVLGLLLLPTAEGDVVLTGLPASSVWILVAVLLPAFTAPMATAVASASRTRRAAADGVAAGVGG